MLARASSDAGTRLRRSKSTSTVHRPPPPISEPLDADSLRQQAVAAATAAFVRAQAHDANERKTKRSSEVSRSKSNASRKSTGSQGQGSHFPPRDSSFRSLHPSKTAQNADAQRQSRTFTINTEKFPAFSTAPSERPLSVPRPLSAQPSLAFSEHTRPATQPKGGPRSAASSITSQQIRKARSMYYASSVQTGSPIARPPAKYLTTPPPVTVPPTLEIPAHRSAVRKVDLQPPAEPRIPATVTADESIDKARDKYLQTFQDRSIKHKPSLFMAPFMKRQDKGKEKSKRLSSGFASANASAQLTPIDSTADVTLNDFMPQLDKKDKRSFSGSLKSKIKRVFRRTSKASPNLPVQQIEASRDYFESAEAESKADGDLYGIPTPDELLLQRVRHRTPSGDGARPAYLRSASRTSSNGSLRSKGSGRSLHSEVNASNPSASRATSWGTTSTGDTLTQRAIKRMSVIHEAKDSIGSEADRIASISTKRKSLPLSAIGGLAAFREPMPMESLLEESSTPVDPKRVFSALMKEIGTSKPTEITVEPMNRTPGAESDVFESSTTKILHASGRELHSSASRDFRPNTAYDQRPPSRRPASAAAQSTRSKTSSIRTLGRAIRSTIRTVTPGEHPSSSFTEQPSSLFGSKRVPSGDDEMSSSPPSEREDCITFNVGDIDDQATTKIFSPSREQIEKRVERAKERWKTPLDDVDDLQFPRETDRVYNVANFSRRAVSSDTSRTIMEQIEVMRSDLPEASVPPTPSPRPIMSPLSPSVYSRNTDGISILPNDSVMSFGNPAEGPALRHEGSAVILTSQSVRSFVVGTPSPPRRTDSTRSSRDWKAWLSHEVSSITSTSQEELKIDERYMTPSGKHRRESTRTSHTDQDDTTVILRPSCDTVIACADSAATPTADANTPPAMTRAPATPYITNKTAPSVSAVLEKSQSHTDTFKEVTPEHTPPAATQEATIRVTSRPGSTPIHDRPRIPSFPSHASSASQPSVGTPASSRMNERFPYIVNTRRYSHNSSRSSRQSKSPPESLASLKSNRATSTTRVYTDLAVPRSDRSSQPVIKTTARKSDVDMSSKENLTPPSVGSSRPRKRLSIPSAAGLSRPRSLLPLTSVELNRSSTNIGAYATNTPETKHTSSPASASSPTRVLIRATTRSISPEKMSRRPKSAFDLRATRTSLPRPASELRRPALHLKTSTSSLALNKEPSPGAEDRVIDSILERSDSVTPGQRMADRFLRERKSTSVMEGEKPKGGSRLEREDTPAFL